MSNPKRLYRQPQGAMLGGVCSGLAEVYGWDVTWVRVIIVIIALMGVGSPVLLYIILWIVIPDKSSVVDHQAKDDYKLDDDDYKY